MANKKILTEIEREFRKERRRVTQLIRRARKRGYIVPADIQPDIPKTKTKSDILELQAITPESIYKASQFKDPISKEVFTGEQGREIERYRKQTKIKEHRYTPTTKKVDPINVPQARSTKVQREYTKERERIKSFLKRARARGFIFPDDILPDRVKHPTPEQLKQLKELTPEKLYSRAVYLIDPKTGEVTTGTERRQQERKTAAEKAKRTRAERLRPPKTPTEGQPPDITDTVLLWVQDMFENADTSGLNGEDAVHKQKHISQGEIILNNAILKYGRNEVARRLEENRDAIQPLINSLIGTRYDDLAIQLLSEFHEILSDTTISVTEVKQLENYFESQDSIMSLDELMDITAATSYFN